MEESEANITELKVIPSEPQNDFIFSLNNMNYIEDSLNELASSPKVVVYYGVPCCGTLCSCCCTCVGSEGCCSCGDYYQYSTLSVKNDSKNYLFKNVVKLYCCDICCCSDKKRRLKYCKSYAVNSYEQFLSKEAGVLTSIMENENKCLCCTCSDYFEVRTLPNNNLAGIVAIDACHRRCCCCCMWCKNCIQCIKECCKDYYYCCDILSPNKELIYTIYLLRCCIQCCPSGDCETLDFVIKNPKDVTVGKITGFKRCCEYFGCFDANYGYKIKFPENETIQNKLTIINAVIILDLRGFAN